MVKKSVWMVYDLALGGDFEGLYTWLEAKNAIECGTGAAFFKFELKENILQELKKSIKESVKIQKKDRIYIIYRDARKMKGNFIFGERKRNPWAGYAVGVGENEEEELE
ncbi:Uncharacterised protein [uncultured archaeon]|nr:Uncharacterised protein [uncultured archaeon]